ncbi:MAG: exported protein of unknown function [Candidatus Saccharibacteria bacterium]|nr:exported protein of unknown function [Candidatus Saccharibacteria bacterium]
MALSVRPRLKFASPKRYIQWFTALSGRSRLIIISMLILVTVVMIMRPALAATVDLVPNATVSNAWTANASCTTTAHTCIDEGSTANTTDYIGTGTALQEVSSTFDMSDPTGVGVASQVTLFIHARSMANVGTLLDSVDMNLTIGGTPLTVQNNVMTTAYAWYSVTYTGNWSQTDLANMQASFTRIVRGTGSATSNDDDIRIASAYVQVTYTAPVTTTQAAYRFYQNVNDGSSSFTTPTVRSTSTSVTNPVDIPVGTTAGDLIVLVYAADTGNMSAMTFPSGFTEISATTNGTAAGHLKIATKTATGSEPTTYAVGMPVDASVRIDAITIQNANTSVAPVVAATQTASSSTSHTAPSVTPTGPNDLLLSVASINTGASVASASWTAPSGMTELTDSLSDGYLTTTVASQALLSNSATGTRTFGLTASRSDPAITASVSFQGTGSATGPSVGTPLAARDTAAVAPVAGTPFRLRLNLEVTTAAAPIGSAAYKLQYAERGSDNSCDATFTNESYSDVTTTSAIKFYNNSSAPDAANMAASGNDPIRSGITPINQTYEELGGFNNVAAIPAGQDGIWDFSLTFDASAPAGQYCFRAVRNDNTTINTYTVMPEIGIRATVDQASYRFYTNDATAPSSSYTAPTVRSFSTAGTPTVTKPSSIVAGDLLVIVYATDSGDITSMTMPSGFTEIVAITNGNGAGHLKVATKVATGSEPASYVVGTPSNASVRLDVLSVQDVETSVAPAVASALTASSSTTHVAPSVTPTGPNDLLLSVAAAAYPSSVPTTSWTAPSGMTEVTDSSPDGWISATVARQALVSGAATGTKTFSLSSSAAVLGLTASISIQGIQTSTGLAVGAPLAAQDTVAVGPVAGTPFRLRLNLGVTDAGLLANIYKLQYVTRIGGSCANGVYSDITTSSPLKFYDNATIADGYAYSILANDPTRVSITPIGQTYKESNPFTVASTIAAGQDGLWDFAFTFDASAPAGDRYCIRAVTGTGAALNAYTQSAEVIVPGTAVATLMQQLRGGQSVVEGDKRKFIW